MEPSACRAENGQVIHSDTKRSLSYGKLVEKASHLSAPKEVALKDPKDFKLIGKATKRLDTPDKTNGKAIFGLDVAVPGMLVAVVARPPVFGGKVKSFNADKAKAVEGVRHVVEIERGVAVVADGFWPAKLGREALEIAWDEGPLAALDSRTQGEQYAELAQKPGAVARKEGDVATALGDAAKKLEAVYELPYLAHATMEPMNAVADVPPGQLRGLDRHAIPNGGPRRGGAGRRAEAGAGPLAHDAPRRRVRPPRRHRQSFRAGGGANLEGGQGASQGRLDAGRRHARRILPAARLSPVRAGLDAAGALTAWQQRIVCQSFIVGTPFEGAIIKDGVDDTAVEGAADMPYQIPNLLVQLAAGAGRRPDAVVAFRGSFAQRLRRREFPGRGGARGGQGPV